MKDDFALWQEYSKTNSSAVREQLIVNYAYLVKYIVSRMPQAAIPGVDYDDLVGYGVLGLIDAIERFDMSRGVKFETYAMTRSTGGSIIGQPEKDGLGATICSSQSQADRVRHG